MKRRLIAAFLAMTLVLSSSTLAWAAEGEENVVSDASEYVLGGDDDIVSEPVKPVLPIEAADTENDKTENEEGITEETGTDEKTLKGEDKAVDSETISGTLDSGIIWELTDGVLTISGNGVIQCGYNEGWSEYEEDIVKVVVEEGATEIGSYAFSGCTKLSEVLLPETMAEIGYCGFKGCSNLHKISIPNGVTDIGMYAFSHCTSLQEIVIPEGVKRIGVGVFEECSSLSKVSIPSGVTEIAVSAFYKCEGLTNVNLPNSVTKIEYYAFGGCKSLSELKVPKSLKSIGHHAFGDCNGLKKVTFEGDAPEITGVAAPFENVKASAYYPAGNQTWTDEIMRSMGTGLLWVSEKTTLLKIVPEATDFTYVIGSSGGVTIKCTGELKDFVNVYMDGVEVDPGNYTLREGSTILTFATKYLDTLSVGKHTVTLNYTYGSVDTELTVLASGDGNGGAAGGTGITGTASTGSTSGASNLKKGLSPKTGDEASLLLWTLAAMCSLGAGAAVIRKKRSA